MKTLISGKIKDFVPFFNAYPDEEGNLVIAEDGAFSMTVDTGFSGGIALPPDVIEKMGLEMVDFDTFKLATGEIIELPVFLGKVILENNRIETWFIPGDSLLGMEFLSSLGRILFLNFEEETIKLGNDFDTPNF